jgi:hypothetical protein
MANGDAAAAAGLLVFPDTQDLKEGYDNDNIRGDEIAAVMVRTSTLESNEHTAKSIVNASVSAVTVTNGGTLGIGSLTVAAVPYPRDVEIFWAALCGAGTDAAAFTDLTLRIGSTDVQAFRVHGQGSGGGSFPVVVAANAAMSCQIVASPTGGTAAISGNPVYTQLRAVATTIA